MMQVSELRDKVKKLEKVEINHRVKDYYVTSDTKCLNSPSASQVLIAPKVKEKLENLRLDDLKTVPKFSDTSRPSECQFISDTMQSLVGRGPNNPEYQEI